ncbi:cell envelope integrity protein TolA [Methylophilaceae bacterium]|nr:cell envelope integrity protein TolA [Methylophilaceae bacterium]
MNIPQFNFDSIRNSKFFVILESDYNLQANLFSFLIHFALFIFMIFSIQWQTKIPNFAEVELWDAVPTQIKNKQIKTKSVKTKQIKKTRVLPPKIDDQQLKLNEEAEIRLKKKKAAEKKALARKKKLKEIKKLQAKLLKQEEIEKLQDKVLEEEKLDNIKDKLLEQERIEQLQDSIRDDELKKKPTIAIEADKEVLAGINSGELDRFKALIQQKIQQNVNNQLCGLDRVELEFEISLMPTGDLLGEPKMTQSSKISSCDAAVERAILQSQPLPIPNDKELFKRLKDLKLKFHPNGHYDL